MSQERVLYILAHFGGRAGSGIIIGFIRKNYPDDAMAKYVGVRLTQLRKGGDVDYDSEKREWCITEQGWERVKMRQRQEQTN